MHAITLAKLSLLLQQRKDTKDVAMLDVGCGWGYSTLLYADLASQILKHDFEIVGTDYHEIFVEKCMLMLDQYPIQNAKVNFIQHDFLEDNFKSQFDICTFGFEVSLDLLHQKQESFKTGAHLIVPISEIDFALEQDFQILRYSGKD